MTDPTIPTSESNSIERIALWTPGWYELDQSLNLGVLQRFWFYQTPPVTSAGVTSSSSDIELVFYNQLASAANHTVRYAMITEMSHPELGLINRVDTDGLDYIFYPVSGEEVIVNAEEDPGSVYESELKIDDWSLQVKLTQVSEPVTDLV